MKERHSVRIMTLTAATLAVLALAGHVYAPSLSDNPPAAPSTPASNPPWGFWQYLESSIAPNSVPVTDAAVNKLLKQEPTLADLDQWKKTEGENGEKIFTTQTKDGFWAKIVVSQEQEAWSAKSYADDLLVEMRKADSGARVLTSDMTPEEITIQKGEYLIIARSEQSPESVGLGSLTYLMVVSAGQFSGKVNTCALTMRAPHDEREREHEKQAVKALQSLAENPLSKL